MNPCLQMVMDILTYESQCADGDGYNSPMNPNVQMVMDITHL